MSKKGVLNAWARKASQLETWAREREAGLVRRNNEGRMAIWSMRESEADVMLGHRVGPV